MGPYVVLSRGEIRSTSKTSEFAFALSPRIEVTPIENKHIRRREKVCGHELHLRPGMFAGPERWKLLRAMIREKAQREYRLGGAVQHEILNEREKGHVTAISEAAR